MWHTSLGLLATGFFARSMAFCLSLHGGGGQLWQFFAIGYGSVNGKEI